MRKIGSAVVVAAALVCAAPAGAQVALDLKVAYAIPTGDLKAFGPTDNYDGPMKNTWSGAIPIEVAGRYRFSPSFSAGVYYQYAPAFVATRFCLSGMTCSGYDMRVGVEAVYAFLPERTWNPWVSLGTGWQWTRFSVATDTASVERTYSGWEYFNVQAGVDWNLSKTFAFGPYVGFFGGSYSTLTGSSTGPNTGGSVSGSIPSGERAFHGWMQFGLKGTVSL